MPHTADLHDLKMHKKVAKIPTDQLLFCQVACDKKKGKYLKYQQKKSLIIFMRQPWLPLRCHYAFFATLCYFKKTML